MNSSLLKNLILVTLLSFLTLNFNACNKKAPLDFLQEEYEEQNLNSNKNLALDTLNSSNEYQEQKSSLKIRAAKEANSIKKQTPKNGFLDRFKRAGKKIINKESRKAYNTSNLHQGLIKYTIPHDWEQIEPKGKMRLEEYRFAPNSTLSIFYFPGMPGSVENNLSRWRRQFADYTITKAHYGADHLQRVDNRHEQPLQQFKQNNLAITIFQMKGDYLESLNPFIPDSEKKVLKEYTVWATIVETADAKWFFKAIGPTTQIEKHQGELENFVSSFDRIK